MFNFSQNYQLRKCFLQREQVPSQSLMKKTMCPALANVYFKSMNPKLKVLAGLEPPMKGGGSDWMVPPEELLQGRTVLKPFNKKHMEQWNCSGLDELGMILVMTHRKRMKAERKRLIYDNDVNWRSKITIACHKEWEECSAAAAGANTKAIENAFQEFTALYTTSINKFQNLLFDAAVNRIQKSREETFQHMQTRYEQFLHQQASMLYDRYNEKLRIKMVKLKANFIQNVKICRSALSDRLHDINLEKYVAVEKLRHFLECQALACQVYVALKEQQECAKEIELAKHKHSQKLKILKKDLDMKDFEIHLAEEKLKERKEFDQIWTKKVCHVIKNFQMIVTYSLKMLPEHADFFINVEKLMLLQLSEALENSTTESIISMHEEQLPTPIQKPHSFYLFCDKGYKPKNIEQDLCPKHCTASASQMPVIVINKRCIYSACDNFEQFTDKIKNYIHGRHGEDIDFEDNHDYTYDVPVKYTHRQHMQELKLESSLLQVLQDEIANLHELPVECPGCMVPHCFYFDISSSTSSQSSLHSKIKLPKLRSLPIIKSDKRIRSREAELKHEREPKWESYLRYIVPKKCECEKRAKKHLMEHLPVYMRTTSKFAAPELLNYETCSITKLKTLVKRARGYKDPASPPPVVVPSKTMDVFTQTSDHEYDELCTCFSDDNIQYFINNLLGNQNTSIAEHKTSSSYLTKRIKSFASDRALSLRRFIDQSPEVKEIFMRKEC